MPKTVDPDLQLLDHMLDLHTPADDAVAKDLDEVRAAFKRLGKLVIKKTPQSADRTLALRSIHRATMDSIFAIVGHQSDGVTEEPAPATKTASKATKASAPVS